MGYALHHPCAMNQIEANKEKLVMTLGSFVLALSAIILLLLGFDVIADTGKVHLFIVGVGLIPLGLLLNGIIIPVSFVGRPRS